MYEMIYGIPPPYRFVFMSLLLHFHVFKWNYRLKGERNNMKYVQILMKRKTPFHM